MIVGCNYLVKEFEPDVLVSLDEKPKCDFEKMIDRNWSWLTVDHESDRLTLDGQSIMKVSEVLDFYPKLNSGVIACAFLAHIVKASRVYMIGFDFFRIHPDATQNDLSAPGLRKYRDFDTAFNNLSDKFLATEFIRVGPIHPHDVGYYMGLRDRFTLIDFLEFEVKIATNRL